MNFSDPFGLCPMCLVYGAFEVGASLYDLGDLAITGFNYIRGRASKAELGVTAAGTAAGIWTVGGGLGKVARTGLRAGSKVPLPTLKSSPFGPKIGDEIPRGVPRNWSKDDIEDAIMDYQTSIASRKAELAAFDALGGGSATQRRAHARRISQEEAFLRSLEKAGRDRR